MPAPCDDRRQELALVVKARVVLVRCDELRDDGRALTGAAIVRFEPGERLARALKARRVDELVEHLAVEAHRVGERACVVVPGCGEIATASSSASVATMLLLPLFG